MNPSPNREVALFSAALELSADQRTAYLLEACADDPALRQRLQELLRVHQDAITFLEKKASEEPGVQARDDVPNGTIQMTAAPTEKPGERIGHYKLLQQIGEGGCGVVYMAEQEEPIRRRVALKVIKLGMDTLQPAAPSLRSCQGPSVATHLARHDEVFLHHYRHRLRQRPAPSGARL